MTERHRARVIADDYARAERFLSSNLQRYVLNADIQHHWIGEDDRFWYLRTSADGAKAFVVVDAVSDTESPAFDHTQVALALSRATGERITPGSLPFSIFRYADDGSAIRFQIADRVWTYRLKDSSLEVDAPGAAAHEIPSPDGRWSAFQRDHNIWVRPTAGGAEFALTSDGVEHHAYGASPGCSTHSVTDKRLGKPVRAQAIWSPDSRILLTHRLDERHVKDMFLIQSVPEDGTARPKLHAFRYALPGDAGMPLLEVMAIHVESGHKVKLDTAPLVCLPQSVFEKRDIWWSDDGKAIYLLDRERFSRSVSLLRADPITGSVVEVVKEESTTQVQTNANNIFDYPLVRTLSTGEVIWYSQRDGWGHLYSYDRTGVLRHQITRGDWSVRGIVRIDESDARIYFMASGREGGRDPYEQSMYSIRFDGSGLHNLTSVDADHQWPHHPPRLLPDDAITAGEKAQFSASGRYFLDSYSRPDCPPVLVLRASNGKLIRQVEKADISRLVDGGYFPVEPFKALAADGRTPVYGNLYRPSTFDPSKKYPVIDANYPGPQAIRSGKSFTSAVFGASEAQSLAELGCIVVTVDGRGTPHRSKGFLDYSYGRLDKASDLDDHIAVIRQLAGRYACMDLERVGIDGVSGGGFAAAYAVFAYPDFYKVAVSAEGNHDQRAYLAAWGETYIGSVDRADYSLSSTLRLAKNLTGKLLLMHGELDDNVSPALTMKLVDALIKANRDFDLLILPNENHSAFVTSTYFIRRKWDFFVRHLLGEEPPKNYSIGAGTAQASKKSVPVPVRDEEQVDS